MKPYMESTRRLSRSGLILLVLVSIGSVINAMVYCSSGYIASLPGMKTMFLPLMVFTFAAGLILALDGFSFLNRRAESDFYHALPVSRSRLYWSITFAALTWVVAAVLASVLLTVGVFFITKTSFVALYPIIAVPFYIVATMLVFAATAIGMSLTGTFVTNIAVTLVVLGLLRFVQFCVARGLVYYVQIMSWMDLPWYLTPVTNIATGQLAMLTRNMLNNQLYGWGNILYSLALTAAELAIGCLLFRRRPSELAEHGAKNSKMQTVFACLLILPIGVVIASRFVLPVRYSAWVIVGVAAVIFIIYQITVLRNVKKVLRSLPWMLIPALLSLAVFFGVQIAGEAAKSYVPAVEDVAYIEFPGNSRTNGVMGYEQYRVSQVRFTEEDVKEYVVASLQENVDMIAQNGYVNYDYSAANDYIYTTYEPVTIVLKNGKKIGREISFFDLNALNELREENAEYCAAIRSLPPEESVCYRQNYSKSDPRFAYSEALQAEFYADVEALSLITSDYYRAHSVSGYYAINDQQTFGTLELYGFVGMQRYCDYYEIRLETPGAVTAWMSLQNAGSSSEYFDLFSEINDKAGSFLDSWDYLESNFVFYNVPLKDGSDAMLTYYYGRYAADTSDKSAAYYPPVSEIIEILKRSTPTNDPNGICVFVTWSGRAENEDGTLVGEGVIPYSLVTAGDATNGNTYVTPGYAYYSSNGNVLYVGIDEGVIYSYNGCYRSFTPEDEARIIELLSEWRSIQLQVGLGYVDYENEPQIQVDDPDA